jgi:DNA invertase Pin-like site-specific DNA recombinase
MRAHIYVRISKDTGSKLGIDSQKEDCIKYANDNGMDIVDIYEDMDKGGALPIEKRPELNRAVESLSKGDVILVAKRERLSRINMELDLLDTMVRRLGGNIINIQHPEHALADPECPETFLQRKIGDIFAEYERLVIKSRVKRALKHKRDMGFRLGRVPYGYKANIEGRISRSDYEQGVIKTILDMRLNYKSYNDIVNILNKTVKRRNGKPWHKSAVRIIVTNLEMNRRNYDKKRPTD